MCFRKIEGDPFENARLKVKNPSEITMSTPAGTIETSFNATFWSPKLREYTYDHSEILCT